MLTSDSYTFYFYDYAKSFDGLRRAQVLQLLSIICMIIFSLTIVRHYFSCFNTSFVIG